MRVTYNSPNRSHHYRYAAALARAGCLFRFVSGFSRFSRQAALPEAEGKIVRADEWQNLYLASLRLRLPGPLGEELAYRSKVWIDRCSEKAARGSDLFLFYSGAGLETSRRLGGTGVIRMVEAVNSHVLTQKAIMEEEHRRLGLPAPRFHAREVARRVEEYRTADAVLCPSAFVKKSFEEQGVPAERIFVVPYGIALHGEAAPVREKGPIFRVLYVGQISPRKGLRYLFEAFERLRHPGKELWIVGPRTHETGIEGVKPPEGTTFFGVLKGEELARVYRGADVFVLPSVEEGLALVLGEALSYGLPVIATENSGGADLFTDGKEGFLVPIRAPEAIAEKLELLAGDPDRRQLMAAAGLSRARALDGWESTGQKLVATLQGLVQPATTNAAASFHDPLPADKLHSTPRA